MAREIEIEISPEGIVRGDISGFGGTRCREIADILSEIVGQEVGFEPDSEYFQAGISVGVDVDVETER